MSEHPNAQNLSWEDVPPDPPITLYSGVFDLAIPLRLNLKVEYGTYAYVCGCCNHDEVC